MSNKLFGKQEKIFNEIEKKSFDIDQDRVEKLKELFPNIVSDGKVDWKALKLLLGENVTEEDERYRFTWNGKSKAIRETSIPTSSTLRPNKESSKNWDDTENLYIEGDNLEVLKVLQNSYNGKIKMIYIDPPYNTGNDFIYEDDFTISGAEADKQEGLRDKKGVTQTVDRLTKNSKDSAKYHTNWLNMMYPRLSIARDLLTDDGVIFISIDDNEVDNLKKVCDEIFGENNFISKIVWQHNLQPKGYLGKFSLHHNYNLVYSKSSLFNLGSLERTAEHNKAYSNPDNDPRGLWRLGDVRNALYRPNLIYDIITPSGKVINPPSNGWRWSKETLEEKIKTGEIIFKDNETRIIRKIYLDTVKGRTPESIWFGKEVGTTRDAMATIKGLFEDNPPFDTPKPIGLIKNMMDISNFNSGDIILDFFSGSSTTAHAVMQFNIEKIKHTKFIMVQLPEKTEEKSKAHKAGYKNICEIGKDRIRRAGEKIIVDNADKDLSNLDIGFKTFKIDSSNFNEWDVSYEAMMKSIKESSEGEFTTYKTDRTHLDLVYEIMLKEGLQLTEGVEEIKLGVDTIYKIADGVMYIFLGKLNSEAIESIVEMKKEAQELFGLDNPSVVLNETYLDTEIKSNAKKNFEANGITNIKTL